PILEADAAPLPEAIDPAIRARLLGRHGADAAIVGALALEGARNGHGGGDRDGLHALGTNVLWSEVRWAARGEGVVHLEDLLLRRARLGLLAERGGLGAIDRIRAVVQSELGWDDARWALEEASYRKRYENDYAISPSASQLR